MSAAVTNVAAALASRPDARPTWVRVGTLFDGGTAPVLKNAHLVYDARKILYVGAADQPPPASLVPGTDKPDGDFPDYTALPGLIEAHAHMFLGGAPIQMKEREDALALPDDETLRRARLRLAKVVRTGVMTVRDAGDNRNIGLTLSKESQGAQASRPGEDPLAYVDSPGAAIHRRGRYGTFMAGAYEDFENADACVSARVAQGAARVKLLVSGIINFKKGEVTAAPQFSTDDVKAVVAAARRHERQTLAHASGADGIENAVAGGADSIEHGFFVTRDQLARMRDGDIAWVPTFSPVEVQVRRAAELGWDDVVVSNLQRVLDGHTQSLQHAHTLGVKIIAGSDSGSCGVPHGLGLLHELALMEDAGMPTAAILNAATGASAAFLRFKEPVGRLSPGCRSRFIFTRHSPFATVRNLRKEKVVVFDGRAVECAEMSADGLPEGL